ncbi:MAG: EAL domain-containing protein [Halothiobacillaceae bacterium]
MMPESERRPRVLLVEDEPGDAQLIRWQLLEKAADAFEVEAVDSLAEAEALAIDRRWTPDVILLDLNLPDSTGVETVIRACESLPDAPIVVLTGQTDERAIRSAIDAGAEDFLQKGADGAAIRKAIRYAMLRHRRESESRLAASVFSHAREGIFITQPDGVIIDVNEAFSRITGFTREEAIGRKPSLLKSGQQDDGFYQKLWTSLWRDGSWEGELWNRRKDGRLFPELLTVSAVRGRSGDVTHFVALFTDITDQKRQQDRLHQLAHFDSLTELPNRVLFADRLSQAMARAIRHDNELAVVYIDLDGFKEVNDQFGHEAGDLLLRTLASRMQTVLRETDTVARLGGDEFVAVIVDLEGSVQLDGMLQRLLGELSRPVPNGDSRLVVSASIGVTFFPQKEGRERLDGDQLLRQADQAMYEAKQSGKNRYQFFDSAQDVAMRKLGARRRAIAEAIERDEFQLVYQPVVNIREGRLLGVEALLRWPQPEGAHLMPEQFLPWLDGGELVIQLDAWVIRHALAQLAEWHAEGRPLTMNININVSTIQRPDFAAWLAEVLGQCPNILPRAVCFEVSECSTLEEPGRLAQVMRDCRSMGVEFCLDDFGSGNGSLQHLRSMPISALKMDRRFVNQVLSDTDDMAIVEGILGLALAFRKRVIAKGVATIEQGQMLARLGCDLVQGFAVAHPMEAECIDDWLAAWQPDPRWQNEPRVPREDIPLLFAAVEHLNWVEQVLRHVCHRGAALPPMSSSECRFGQWMETQHPFSSELEAIRPTHERIHEVGNRLVSLPAGAESDALRAQLLSLTEQLVGELGGLSVSPGQTPHPLTFLARERFAVMTGVGIKAHDAGEAG